MRASLERPGRSVPSMSGSRRSIRITSGRCSAASATRRQRARLQRRNPLARSRRGRALGSSRCRRRSGRTAGGRGDGVVTGVSLSMPIRLVLAEDHYLVREGVRACSRRSPTSRSRRLRRPRFAARLRSMERPDVVVTDIRMPPGGADEGIQAAERLRETNPEVGVVVLSQYANPSLRARAPRARQRAARLSPQGAREGSRSARRRDPRRGRRRLGDRPEGRRGVGGAERARRGVAARPVDPARARRAARDGRGKNNAAIAEALFLTESSVEKVIHSIFLKLGLTWERRFTSASRR